MNFLQKILSKKSNPYPVNRTKGDIQGVGNITASWLNWGTDAYFYAAYQNVPQLRSVIDKLASSYSRGRTLLKENDKIVTAGTYFDLMENPNIFQSKYEFWKVFYKNLSLFDRVHVYKQQTGLGINQLIILPTIDVFIKEKRNSNILTATKQENLIDYYKFFFKGNFYRIETSDVWTFSTSSLHSKNNYLLPDRKLQSLLKPVSNINLNYKSRNELMKGLGAIGMISSDDKNAGEPMPLRPEDVKDLQREFAKYRLADGDYKYLITKANVKWTPMTVAVKDMMFKESLTIDTDTICDVLNYPSVLLASSQREVKYTNFKEAKEFLYTDKIIPDAKEIDFSFNNNFDFGKLKLETDFSHLEILQGDKKDIAVTNQFIIKTIEILNKQIFDKIIPKSSGVNQLILLGYTEEKANSVLIN